MTKRATGQKYKVSMLVSVMRLFTLSSYMNITQFLTYIKKGMVLRDQFDSTKKQRKMWQFK